MIIDKSEKFIEVLKAMALANAETEHAVKNRKNSHFKNEYADLAEIISAIKSTYKKHGLALVQVPTYEAGQVKVFNTVIHNSGEFVTFAAGESPVSKTDPQGVGSAITYLRRYTAAAIAFITQEDDDGELASGEKKTDEAMEWADKLSNCKVLPELAKKWSEVPQHLQKPLIATKEAMKKKLSEVNNENN